MTNVIDKALVDSEKVKSCWQKIKSAKGVDFFINSFYQYLFEQHPETHSLFPQNITEQKTKLLTTLDNVINGIDHIEILEPALIELGKLHKNIGITKEMFDVFISIMVDAAKTASDDRLTDQEIISWEKAFREVSSIMLKTY